MSGWRGIRYTDLKKILHPGRERDGPPNGGRGGFRSRRGCAPHFLFETSKRKCAAPGGKENMFGGSACAGAALLPPAGKVGSPLRQSETETRRPWGNLQPGEVQGYPLPLSPLPLTLPRRSRQRLAKRKAQKEKLVECILAPRRCRHHPPRDSSHDLAEDDSVPEGKPKSALAPIRRPPSAQRRECAGVRQKRPFLLDRALPSHPHG